MRKQFWFCEACLTVGVFPIRHHAGVSEVVIAIGQKHRIISPSCPHSAFETRVLNLHEILKPHVPEWALNAMQLLIETVAEIEGELPLE